jgi:hypothetical protein
MRIMMRLLRGGGQLAMLGLGLPGLFVACMPAQPNRGLEHELRTARAEAAFEQRRVHDLEARLARLEQRAELPPVSPAPSAAAGEAMVTRQLDALITLNQELLREAQTNRQSTVVALPNVAPAEAATPSTLAPECDTGLTAEQKILQLVLELKGERSPWRVDGLSYEESQALRVLLRSERQLDRDNPWQ